MRVTVEASERLMSSGCQSILLRDGESDQNEPLKPFDRLFEAKKRGFEAFWALKIDEMKLLGVLWASLLPLSDLGASGMAPMSLKSTFGGAPDAHLAFGQGHWTAHHNTLASIDNHQRLKVS